MRLADAAGQGDDPSWIAVEGWAAASNVEAGGRALVMAALLAVRDEPGTSIALLDDVVDEKGTLRAGA